MLVECVCNDGFEDMLTVGYRYNAERGSNSFMIQNNYGRMMWFGEIKFKVIIGDTMK